MVGAILVHSGTTALLAAALAGVAIGFLPFNWSPAKCFMGDAGSYFCGGMVGALLIAGQGAGVPIAISGLASVLFLADAVGTLLVRLVSGKVIWRAHRSHIYQRLVLAGWSHARVAAMYLAAAVSIGAASLLYLSEVR
jgi:UDP-N-acetylmuramyl pentapeptide phosphotransferase/UDP-N-acetylglucosamine-1-phosphate transferase